MEYQSDKAERFFTKLVTGLAPRSGDKSDHTVRPALTQPSDTPGGLAAAPAGGRGWGGTEERGHQKEPDEPQPSRPRWPDPGCSAAFLSSALAVCGRGFAPTPQALTSIWGKHHVSLGVPGLEGHPASGPGPGADRQTDGVGLGHTSHGLRKGAGKS